MLTQGGPSHRATKICLGLKGDGAHAAAPRATAYQQDGSVNCGSAVGSLIDWRREDPDRVEAALQKLFPIKRAG